MLASILLGLASLFAALRVLTLRRRARLEAGTFAGIAAAFADLPVDSPRR